MNRREFLINISALGLSNIISTPLVYSLNSVNNQSKSLSLNTITLTAAGDTTTTNAFNETINYLKNNSNIDPYDQIIQYVKNEFTTSDINILNLEEAITNSKIHQQKEYAFASDSAHVKLLKKLNINIVNLANNHFMDYYNKGALDTIQALEDNSIEYCGGGRNIEHASQLKTIYKNNITVGFLGYAIVGRGSRATIISGTNPYDKEVTQKQISNAKDLCDILVISSHWGKEREYNPSKEQIETAKVFINAGADIILGHHPHVIQEAREYKNKLIFYSLGNFIFGGNTNPTDKNGLIAKIELNKQGIINYRQIPIITHTNSRTIPQLRI